APPATAPIDYPTACPAPSPLTQYSGRLIVGLRSEDRATTGGCVGRSPSPASLGRHAVTRWLRFGDVAGCTGGSEGRWVVQASTGSRANLRCNRIRSRAPCTSGASAGRQSCLGPHQGAQPLPSPTAALRFYSPAYWARDPA